jgi:hypothetical protein
MQQQLQSLPQLLTSGTIEAVVPGYIKVNSGANQVWILQVLPNARCAVTGKATPDALAPGFFIRFVGEVNKRGAVEQKVGKLTIFTPSQFRQPGAEPDSGLGTTTFGPRPGEERRAEEGQRPAFGAGAGAEGKNAPGTRKLGSQPGAAGKSAGPQVFDVRGQIVGVSNSRLNLQVPNAYFRPSLRVEVAEDAEIDVELDDAMAYTLARKGDKVRIQGRQGMGNRGFAEEVDIILSDPLGGSPDGKKVAKGGRSKRGADADEPSGAKSADGKGEKKDADAPAGKGKKAGDGDDADAAPAKRSKTADADAPEKPAKKKKKAIKADAGDGS